ncbi:MAG: hypothetical protein GY943_37965 [Chloroflexi bacterium]|nr:hypothetical protein [Chloroflexota bacterium]
MSDYDNSNRGAIWGNTKKETASHPDLKGEINATGEHVCEHCGKTTTSVLDFWVSAWKRKPDANPKAPALSMSLTAKDTQQQQAPAPAPTQDSGLDDDIPF